jgi:hypothetical protein
MKFDLSKSFKFFKLHFTFGMNDETEKYNKQYYVVSFI